MTQEFKGTKGERIIVERTDWFDVVDQNGDRITSFDKSDDRSHYDALLDAHAPEMLERLKEQNIDLKILKENLRIAATFDFRLEGYPDQVQKWIDANNELITKATTI